MKEKKPVYKKWWFWVIAFLFFSIFWGAAHGNVPSQQEASSSASSSVAPQEETPEEVPAEPLTTKEQLDAIIDNLNIDCSDVDIVQGTPDNDRYNISYKLAGTAWDETHLVSDCLSDYINICAKAYQIEDVNKIQLFVFMDFMDTKGNQSSEKAFSMCMPKEIYDTYNWENLKYVKGNYVPIAADCEFISIHESIVPKVDFDEVMYK